MPWTLSSLSCWCSLDHIYVLVYNYVKIVWGITISAIFCRIKENTLIFTDVSNIYSCFSISNTIELELSNYIITLHIIIINGTNAMNLFQSKKNVFLFRLKCGRSKLNKSQIFNSNALQWLNCILPPGFDLEQSLLACIRCNREKHSILMQFAHFRNQRCSLKTGCNSWSLFEIASFY